MARIFGTDGIRGYANVYPMTADLALKVGMAAALHLSSHSGGTNRVLIGKDTRLSGYMFENALVAGLTSMGKDVLLLGPMPTPAVAMLTRSMRADLGIMISASHNPYFDNGIKLFDKNGHKLSDEDENAIEELLVKDLNEYLIKSDSIGKVERLKESSGRYIEFVKSSFPSGYNLKKMKIVVDCANGAVYRIAPAVLYELGAEVIAVGASPNGININENCGSTHIENLREEVLKNGADVGISFDGDADRVLMVDEKANIIDGDNILAIIATKLKKENKLKANTVVGTIMANMGFENYLQSQGITLVRTKVGDRYVSESMENNGYNLGGEQSGHVILSDYNTTGDGLLASLFILSYILDSQESASKCCKLYTPMPQVLKNLRYNDSYSQNPLDNENIKLYIENKQKEYKDKVRILVRKSGTEKLIRVMVEGEDGKLINGIAEEIVSYINSCI
ncbi:MAG: phosphoglucosamine mutase [Alphaproteobacteria bacterium]|jgi:phosphoglucosamine mutase|nr:phosphoglucosamine mutase [Alphaproteobacteria bacterium]